MNQYIVQNMNLLSNVEEFVKKSVEMTVVSLIDFYFKYNQVKLHSELCDMTAFQMLLELL